MTTTRLPTLFIPHGGGPCFFMDAPASAPHLWDGMAAYLRGIGASLGVTPRAVLVISAHWDESVPTVGVAAAPDLLFDYYGFPAHTYQLKYPAPGSPALAARVRELLGTAGIDSGEDASRAFDHGVFVPFLLVYPDADVPIVQLSLRADFDAAAHLAIGRALAPLRDEGVLIVGSGMSYHNLREFFSANPAADAAAERFDAGLTAAVENPDAAARAAQLVEWERIPGARSAHPREEHLLPLMVAAGAAGDDRAHRVFNDRLMGKPVSAYRFG